MKKTTTKTPKETSSKSPRKTTLIKKVTYSVGTRADYNKALVKHGSITFWFDEAAIEEWHHITGQGKIYGNIAMICALTLRKAFGLALRKVQEIMQLLVKTMDLPIRIPNYSTLCRRGHLFDIPTLPSKKAGPIHVIVNHSGLKIYSDNEWQVRKEKVSENRKWRTLELVIEKG